MIPGPSNPNWEKVIAGEIKPNIEFLGTKILLGRLILQYQGNSSAGTIRNCIIELKNFLEKNLNVPKVQADIKSIFGGTA